MKSDDVNKVLRWFRDEIACLKRMAVNDPKMMDQVRQLEQRVEALLGEDLGPEVR